MDLHFLEKRFTNIVAVAYSVPIYRAPIEQNSRGLTRRYLSEKITVASVRKNSQLTPAVAVSNLIGQTELCEGFGAAVAQAESVGKANSRRIKSQSRTQSTLNNVRELKAKLDLEDDCWIYDIADGSVVTSSTLRIQFAAKMYQTDSLLSECPLFIDGCEKTLNENCTEIKLVLYHPVLHKVWIAKYKAPGLTGSSQAVEHLLKCVSAMCYAKHQMPFKPIQRVISPHGVHTRTQPSKEFKKTLGHV